LFVPMHDFFLKARIFLQGEDFALTGDQRAFDRSAYASLRKLAFGDCPLGSSFPLETFGLPADKGVLVCLLEECFICFVVPSFFHFPVQK